MSGKRNEKVSVSGTRRSSVANPCRRISKCVKPGICNQQIRYSMLAKEIFLTKDSRLQTLTKGFSIPCKHVLS